jgi:hypothetical protein
VKDNIVGPGRNVLADPLFVDPKNGDFRLQADSPCLGEGADVGMLFKGKAPDLGAFLR